MESNAGAAGGNPYLNSQASNNSSGGKQHPSSHHLWQQMNQMPKFSASHISQNRLQQQYQQQIAMQAGFNNTNNSAVQ